MHRNRTPDSTVATAIASLRKRFKGVKFACVETSDIDALDPAEVTIDHTMAPARRQQFVAGRVAARDALGQLGCTLVAVRSDADGVPIWPSGIVGSISHKRTLAIAAAVCQGQFAALGVDLELDESRNEVELVREVLVDRERPVCARLLAAHTGLMSPATCVLSAKEAVYKALFPQLRLHLDWADIVLRFDVRERSFETLECGAATGSRAVGGYERAGRWFIAVAVVPA